MYVRASHRPQSDSDVLELLRTNAFATLVTAGEDGMIASHLPMLIDTERGEHGTLLAHMARANPQSQHLDAADDALVIFAGAHGYISPSWYEDRATAPTWDYVAVHCYGRPRIHTTEEAARNIERLVDTVEATSRSPWSIRELPEGDFEKLLRKVVSFEIPITRLDAKFKLNQGETRSRNLAAIEALERQGNGVLAALIRRYNDL